MRILLLAALTALAACGPGRPDDESGPFTHRADHERDARDPGPHAFRKAKYVGKGRHEEAFAETCLAYDSAWAQEPNPRSRAALEGLIRLAAGERVDRSTIFAPGFKIEPVHDYDVIIQHKISDFLTALKGAVAVDYRHSRNYPHGRDFGYRYLARGIDLSVEAGGNEYYPVSYDTYTCADIYVDLRFDGPTQQYHIKGLAFGPPQHWRVIRKIGGKLDSARGSAMSNQWHRTRQLPDGF